MVRQVTDVAWIPPATRTSAMLCHIPIAKVDKMALLKSWGEPGDQPGQFTFRRASPSMPNSIYVPRGNRPHQVFNTDGKFLRQSPSTFPAPADLAPPLAKALFTAGPCPRST